MTTKWIQAHRRLRTAARILKAYFEAKLGMGVEILTDGPVPRLQPLAPVSPTIASEINEMCDSILGGLHDMEGRREALETLQNQMERQLVELPSNVIALHRGAQRSELKDTIQ